MLFVTDHARANSGPNHRVVSCLNAMSIIDEVELTLLAGDMDQDQPFTGNLRKYRSGYKPHSLLSIPKNLYLLWSETRDCDIIYVSNGTKNFLYGWLFKSKRRKFVAGPDITGIPLLSPPTDPNYIMTVKMVDTWIETSEIRAPYVVSGGARREDFVVLRNGIDLNKFSPEHRSPEFWKKFGLNPKSTKIIFVASRLLDKNPYHENVKGTHVLLTAFEKLSASFPDADLVLVGEPGGEQLENYGSHPHIHFIGKLFGDDLAVAYASSDIGCITSEWESFSFVGAEMFCSGLPIVSSKVGVMPEIIEHGESGILFDLFPKIGQKAYDNADERLIEALSPLLRDGEMRKRMGQNARKQGIEKLSMENFSGQLLEVFKAVLQNRRTPEPGLLGG